MLFIYLLIEDNDIIL